MAEENDIFDEMFGKPVVRQVPQVSTTDDPLEDFLPCTQTLPAPPPDDLVRMPDILARSLSAPQASGWAYHPRSDRHSTIKCLGLLFDLVRACPVLADRLRRREVVFGINAQVAGKALDLVVGEPDGFRYGRALAEIVSQSKACLTLDEQAALARMPLYEGAVGRLQLAVEAKAVMTDHVGALPRVSDELERFRARVQREAVAVALLLVNTADRFVSPGRNSFAVNANPHVNWHRQPHDALCVVRMAEALPHRTTHSDGFDAVALVFLHCQNDGTTTQPCKLGPDHLSYAQAVRQIIASYLSRHA